MAQQPRGLRNNNPLNIRKGNNWQGERKPQTDPAFEEFETMELGLRAAFIIIRGYVRKRIDTPTAIVSRWAPPTENDTSRYLTFVCNHAQLIASRSLKWSDKNALCRLLRAMAQYECGVEIPLNRFEYAYALANQS